MNNAIVALVMYHGIIRSPLKVADWCFLDADLFHRQLKLLKEHFDLVSLPEAIARMAATGARRPAAVVTFDDGFQNNYDVAFPILLEEGVPATIFVVTGIVGTDDTMWFCRLNRALANTNCDSLEWRDMHFDLIAEGGLEAASNRLQACLKEFPHRQLLDELRTIIESLGDDPDSPIEANSPFRILNEEQLAEMAASGMIDVGAHTHSHAILSRISRQQRRNEIVRSLHAVRKITGKTCEFFAYPNGRSHDYDQDSLQLLSSLDVRAAVTAIEGINNHTTPCLELRRCGFGGNTEAGDFERMMKHVSMEYALERLPNRNFEEVTLKNEILYSCWDSSSVLTQTDNERPLLNQLLDHCDPKLDCQEVARYLFESVPRFLCCGTQVWADLWPGLKIHIQGFLEALEEHTTSAGLARQTFEVLQRMITGNQVLRVANDNIATLIFPPDDPHMLRIAIQKISSDARFDTQLNHFQFRIDSGDRYAVSFLGRADTARSIGFGVARARAPWDGLGLYKRINLSADWQSFAEEFMAIADEENARIHFDVGGNEASVELSSISIVSLKDDD